MDTHPATRLDSAPAHANSLVIDCVTTVRGGHIRYQGYNWHSGH